MNTKINNFNLSPFLISTTTIETTHPDVVAFTVKHTTGVKDAVDTAVHLFYAVRDGIRYDPYTVSLNVDSLKASHTIRTGRAWCVPKAILLAVCCRSVGIPAKLGYADDRNHLSTARMRQNMRTDIFHWHGYTSIYLDGRWLKATPAFNIELCRKFNLLPLEFDGKSDALFHAYDAAGYRHMEYIRYRGEFADVPVDAMEATFRKVFSEL
ncbi:MAG: transglutaminase family protein [Syntrophales bacterium]|jgi:transglutaminase-like putative cysteine protease